MKTPLWLLVGFAAIASAQEPIFRNGNELVIPLEIRGQTNQTAKLSLNGGAPIAVNLADSALTGAVVVDLAGFGELKRVDWEVPGAAKKTVSPVPEVKSLAALPLTDQAAFIEPAGPPRILLPEAVRLRAHTLTSAARSFPVQDITFSVVTESDLPVPASANYILVSRQSFAPKDANLSSLYLSYRKPVYDTKGGVESFRKFLVEVPLDPAWLQPGDQAISLPLDRFRIHTGGMLGSGPGGLAQGGQSADIDDEGRIYLNCPSDGAGLVRFNPHTGNFEAPPVDFNAECRRLIPDAAPWNRNWDRDLGEVLVARGRVYILFARNYRVETSNGRYETCSGLISVPQAHWDDADRFRADIRLHLGCWEGAPHRLYAGDVAPGTYKRKVLAPTETRDGIYFAAASDAEGGPWRVTLDAAGNVTRVIEGGGPLSTGEAVLHRGLTKQRLINVGAAGRPFVTHNYGETQIPRSGLGLILPTGGSQELAGKDGRFLQTYPGAPAGTLTLRFNLAAKIKAEADRFGDLAQSLRGISQGPNYNIAGIPGEPDRAIGVCEYGYFLSKLDFSRLATEKKVYKEYLPLPGGGAFPAAAGLGPYNSAWVRRDDGLWLYYMGYTGMSRLRYPQDGGYAVELFHPRLHASPVDGHPRNSVKDFLHLIPSLDDSLVNIGRGRSGRGGGAMSAGLEKFDPKTLGPSQTAVFLNRACNLYTPAARVVISAKNGQPRQEIFAAGGLPRVEYIQDLPEPLRPAHTGPKVYAYQVSADGNLAPRFGFSLPPLPDGKESRAHVALSPCRQYLVILQEGGSLLSYHMGEDRFVDGLRLQGEGGASVPLVEFERPSTFLWTAPGGEMFFLAANGNGITFHQVLTGQDGALTVRPHVSIAWKAGESSVAEFQSVVKGFIEGQDGSIALALGGSQEKGSTFVRVISQFIPPARTRK